MAHSGRYVFQMDASSLVAPYDRRSARAPELASVSMTSSVQVPLTEKMTALVAGAPALSSGWFFVRVHRLHEHFQQGYSPVCSPCTYVFVLCVRPPCAGPA